MRDASRHANAVTGEIEGLTCEESRDLVMPMAIAWRAAEYGNDDVGPEVADDAHDVAQNRIFRPVLVRFFGALREPEIVGTCEVLMSAVNSPRRQKFLGTNRP